MAEAEIGLRRDQPREIGAQRPHRRRDRHVVVIEDDDQAALGGGGVIDGLEGHAGAHRAVADHAHHLIVAPLEVAAHRHAKTGGNRSRAVAGTEGVVFGFRPLGEAGKAAAGTQGANAVAASGKNLVGIGLVPNVPDDAVVGGVEDIVQRHRQFHHPETGAEMAAGDRARVDRLGAQFVHELRQLLGRQPAKVCRRADAIKQRSFAGRVQGTLPRSQDCQGLRLSA